MFRYASEGGQLAAPLPQCEFLSPRSVAVDNECWERPHSSVWAILAPGNVTGGAPFM